MALRKLALMHKLYGRASGRCGDCLNFIRGRNCFKCERYGDTRSEASDWAKSWDACGMFGVPASDKEKAVITLVKGAKRDEWPMEGQIAL